MATTDAKPGFRLPWSADRGESEAPAETAGDAPIGEALTTDQEIETPDMIDAAPAAPDYVAAVDDQSAVSETTPEGNEPIHSASDAATAPSGRSAKPNKFMADLTKAMQGAAETAKADTLARFSADAKGHIENIHASTAVEAGELRKQADDDVASIREWSKAEIARIREETDERITHRKSRLEREIEAHRPRSKDASSASSAASTPSRPRWPRSSSDCSPRRTPTRFAAMAESLPEPPPFDTESAEDRQTAETSVAETDDLPAERAVVVEPWPETPAEAATETVDAPEAETTEETEATAEAVAEPEVEATNDEAVETEAVETEVRSPGRSVRSPP